MPRDAPAPYSLSHSVSLRKRRSAPLCGPVWPQKDFCVFYTEIESKIECASSALTLLVGWQEGHLVCKKLSGGCWHGYLSGARCRLAYVPADAIATHCLLLSKIQTGFTFLVPAHPGSPGKRAVKWVCVHRSTCVSRHLQLKLEGLVGAEFYGLF